MATFPQEYSVHYPFSAGRWKDYIDRKFMQRFSVLPDMEKMAAARARTGILSALFGFGGSASARSAAPSAVAVASGPEALALISASKMRCGGCGAKARLRQRHMLMPYSVLHQLSFRLTLSAALFKPRSAANRPHTDRVHPINQHQSSSIAVNPQVGATTLSRALSRVEVPTRPEVVVGVESADDAAVVRVPDGYVSVRSFL